MARADADAISTHGMAVAEALASRLCHDLAGLVGTIAGMLDLADDPDETLPVAREAADQLLRRLRLVRAAWGGGAEWEDGREDGALRGLTGLVATETLRVALDDEAPGLGPMHGRLLLNVALLGAELLRGRGAIGLARGRDDGLAATLSASGDPPCWPDFAAPPPPGARHFQRLWTGLLAAECGMELIANGPVLRIIPRA